MTPKNKGLGRGLGSLLGAEANMTESRDSKAKEVVTVIKGETTVKTRLVEPNRNQPRKEFDENELNELAESIRVHGIIQPLIVTREGEHYKIVAGERRWRAAKLAGLKEIPVIIRDYTDKTVAEVALIENIQRKDLNPIEEAKAYQKLLSDYEMTQEELSERVSKSRTAITNSIRLLRLSENVQALLSTGALSTGHAKVILGLESEELQEAAAKKACAEKLSVRETEKLVKALLNPKPEVKPIKLRNKVAYDKAESDLKAKLGTKVTINRKTETSGRIEIEYYSLEDIERILEHIK